MIRDSQKKECVRLYKEGILTIKEIMAETGIRSEQTIYRILDAAGVPRRPARPTEWRAAISFDRGTVDIINSVKPRNLSAWVCKMIKVGYIRSN